MGRRAAVRNWGRSGIRSPCADKDRPSSEDCAYPGHTCPPELRNSARLAPRSPLNVIQVSVRPAPGRVAWSVRMPTPTALAPGCLLLAFACSAPKVSSDPNDCAPSLRRIAQSVSGRDSVAYADAMAYITGVAAFHSANSVTQASLASTFISDVASVALPSPDSADITAAACLALAGQNAKSIVAGKDSLATRMSASLDERMAVVHRKTLEDARAAFLAVQDSLSHFRVESAKLLQTELRTTIALTVRNQTAHAISSVSFIGRAVTDGRDAPWIEEEFSYRIPGGLAPGASATWRIQPPNTIGANWNRVKVPATARFTVQPTQLYAADGTPLWAGVTFTRADQRLLDSLKAAR